MRPSSIRTGFSKPQMDCFRASVYGEGCRTGLKSWILRTASNFYHINLANVSRVFLPDPAQFCFDFAAETPEGGKEGGLVSDDTLAVAVPARYRDWRSVASLAID